MRAAIIVVLALVAIASAANMMPLRAAHAKKTVSAADPCTGNPCGTTETCCIAPGNQAGCCPAPKACCCPDQAHCCETEKCICTGTCPGSNCACTSCASNGKCEAGIHF